jgi:hypothetical protein
MEYTTFVVQGNFGGRLTSPEFAGAQRPEVLAGHREDVAEQLKNDATGGPVAHRHAKVNAAVAVAACHESELTEIPEIFH